MSSIQRPRLLAALVVLLAAPAASLTSERSAVAVPSTRLPQLQRLGGVATRERDTNEHGWELVAATKPAPESPTKGYLAMLGGICIHLTCGSMYCWGNLISYLPASLKYWNPAGGTGPADAQLVLAFILVSQMTGMPLGPVLEKQLGPQLTAALGSVMMGAGVFLASYAPSLLPFVLSYAVLFGLGVGIAYQVPFITGRRWFPTKMGAVQGAIISGMGASAFLFNLIATKLVNPSGANMVDGAFPPSVTANWPPLLRTLGVTFACLSMAGALLQSNPASSGITYPAVEALKRLTGQAPPAPPKAKAAVKAAAPAGPSVLSLVCSKKFLVYWLMILCSAVSGLNIAGSYKTFGSKQPHLNSDTFLSLVGALSAIGGNAAGRFFWGSLSDKRGFKACFSALTLLQGLTMYNYGRLASYRPTFLLATVFMLFCMGGNFAMFPAQTFRTFGAQGASVYSFLFTGFGCAALLGPLLSTALLQTGGYSLVYSVLALLSATSFTLCRLFL